MSPKIVVDENVNKKIIESLRDYGHDVVSISEDYKSISDVEILQLSVKLDAILLTEDSDFGKWIFAHQKQNVGVLFLRYHFRDINSIIRTLQNVLKKYRVSIYNKFIVITKNKVRLREMNGLK